VDDAYAASDWDEYDPATNLVNTSSHPDFSSSGGTIKFGFMAWGQYINGIVTEGYLDVDNWSVKIYRL
jgi:hypothetical protein